MKRFLISAAVSVISLASFLALPSLADEGKQDCPKDKCSQQVCSEKECAKENCSKQKCGKKECGKKCRAHKKGHGPHQFRHAQAAPDFGVYVAEYFGLTKAQQVKALPIIKEYVGSLSSPGAERMADLDKVLTAEQKQNMQQSAKDGKRPGDLKLSAEQKAKLEELQQARAEQHREKFEAFKERLKPVLTTEQQSKLADFRPPMPPAGPHHGPEGMHKPGPCEFGGHHDPRAPRFFSGPIAKELNLTKEQQDKLKAIVEKYDKQQEEIVERMHKDTEANREAMRKEINGVLNAEQRAKLEERFMNGPRCHGDRPGKPRHHKPAKQFKNEKKHPKHCTKACKCEDKALCKEGKCADDCQRIKIVKTDKK